jgi:ATP-dependent DNA ligase
VNTAPSLHFSDHVVGQGPAFYYKACAMHVEGIVSKRTDAPYTPGNRGLWRKVKCLNRAEFVVVGWNEPEGRRPYLGALLLGYYDPKGCARINPQLRCGGRCRDRSPPLTERGAPIPSFRRQAGNLPGSDPQLSLN